MRGNSILYLDIDEVCRSYHINDSISSYLGDHFEGRFMMDHISHSADIKMRIIPLFSRGGYAVPIDTFQYHYLKTDMCIRLHIVPVHSMQ